MAYSDMTKYFIWCGVLQFVVIWNAVEHKAWDIVLLGLLPVIVGAFFIREARRRDDPK
ncbi:hypothetical protein SAMN05216509_5298 [Pseudomonas sp. B10]|uniref:Uncharacterized protein n=1 Tax=Pseudomonas fluorescens TaxID=294 RepID=A0A5E7BB17_PSEFL|nr:MULTISPECIES: hypothetical protein [Pseudomonas]SIR83682.1 hypothetical protein SAMN05216509_5298 [Pseudomonas sp. B10]VVN88485.1 hypothetical protein PS718_01689 [Pseudomonas fluorescens]